MKKTVKKRTSIKKGKSLKRKSLKRKSVKGGGPEKRKREECPVCFQYITDDDEITLSCTHTFHKTCMTSTCSMPQFDNKTKCTCPLCRGQLMPIDLATLGIYFNTMTEFKEYVNTKLEAKYSRTPSVALSVLKNVLEEFIGPPNYFVRGKILKFRLKDRLLNRENREFEYTYNFENKMQDKEKFDIWYKYFQLQTDREYMVNSVFEYSDNDEYSD